MPNLTLPESSVVPELRVCYESRKAGLGFPACCANKNCDEERKKTPLHQCEMVKVGDAWVDNFVKMGNGDFGLVPFIFTPENKEYVKPYLEPAEKAALEKCVDYACSGVW